MFVVVDSAFNRAWYAGLIGRSFAKPPGFAQVVKEHVEGPVRQEQGWPNPEKIPPKNSEPQ